MRRPGLAVKAAVVCVLGVFALSSPSERAEARMPPPGCWVCVSYICPSNPVDFCATYRPECIGAVSCGGHVFCDWNMHMIDLVCGDDEI